MKETITFEEEQKKYTQPSLELIKFYTKIRNKEIQEYTVDYDISSIKEFTETVLDLIESQKITDAELLCCHASLVFDDKAMIYYFRAVLSRIVHNVHRALHCIHEAFKWSGSSTLYHEYARILDLLGEYEKSRRAKQHAEYKKCVEDTTCE